MNQSSAEKLAKSEVDHFLSDSLWRTITDSNGQCRHREFWERWRDIIFLSCWIFSLSYSILVITPGLRKMNYSTSTTTTMFSLGLVLLVASNLQLSVQGFVPQKLAISLHPPRSHRSVRLFSRKRNKSEQEESSPAFPQLPGIGETSVSSLPSNKASANADDDGSTTTSIKGNFVSPKFELQYTCNVCNMRNKHMVSRLGKFS